MKRLWVFGVILLFMGISLYLRVVPPYDYVFTGEWIKFTSLDAYWQMEQVEKIVPNFLYHFTHFTQPILGEMTFFHWLLSATIWCVSLGNPTPQSIDTIAAYFPAVLGALTIIPVYFLGKVMFNRVIGLIAAGLIAILPGEWLGRSSLGFTDHHVLEVLLSTTAIMFLVMAIKSQRGKWLIIYGLLSTLFMWLYFQTWRGAVVFIIILLITLLVYLLSTHFRHRPFYGLGAGAICLVLVAIIGYRYLVTFYPMWPTVYTTMEMQRLTLLTAWQNFGIITFLVPIVLVLLGYRAVKYGEVNTILLFVWSAVMLVAMLEFRRFAYYYAVNIAFLSGWLLWYVWKNLSKTNLPKALAVTAILCGLIIMPNIQMPTAKYSTPSDAWCETLTWVKENTPEDSLILSWWDYGYWIQRIGERKAYITPSQEGERITETANMFLAPPAEDLYINVEYIILDYSTVIDKLWAIAVWASESEENPHSFVKKYYSYTISSPPVKTYHPAYYQSLMAELYFGSYVSQYELVYASEQEINGVPEVKVFRKRRIGYGL